MTPINEDLENLMLSDEELETLKPEIRAAVRAEIKRRGVEKVLLDNQDRINFYLGSVSDYFKKILAKWIPM